MGNTDNLLTDLAKFLNSESANVPAYIAMATDTVLVSASVDTVAGEYGTRIAVSSSRTAKEVTYEGIINGTLVPASGINWNATYLTPSSTGGGVQVVISLPSLNQTTDFDIDMNFTETPTRI